MRFFLFLLAIFLVGSSAVFAQSETFEISIFGGNDIFSPTTPTLLSANPVATNQIDLGWSSSTDNFAVSGYTVARGGSVIATTTLLNYSDTGLIASTTYSYTVRAFDSSFNYSSSSNSIATTTLSTPVTLTSVSNEGTATKVVLRDFFIETGESTSSLNIETATPVRLEMRWGRTTTYEIGYIVSSVYKDDHTFSVTELEPNTTYVYEIIGYTPRGRETLLKKGEFTTLSDAPITPPVNVSRFTAETDGLDVELDWKNPNFASFDKVRVVRSHLGFPAHPADGAIVYQGLKDGVVDKDILSVYSPVYYTAFVYDIYGNVSSGAVAVAYSADVQNNNNGSSKIDSSPPVVSEATSSINQERVTLEMKMPQASDISVIQLGKKYSMLDSPLSLFSTEEFVVTLPAESVAGNLKSIILTVLDPTDNRKTYSYLLRINHDRSAYVATVPSLNVLGDSQVQLEIFDYEAFVVATYQTPAQFINYDLVSSGDSSQQGNIFYSLLFGLLASVLVIFIYLLIKKKRDEDKK